MPLTNAQKQARWRERNVITLSAPAEEIADKLTATADPGKLHKLAALLNHHLKARRPRQTTTAKPRGPFT